MAGLFKRSLPLWFVVLAWAVLPARVAACPFCASQGQSLTGEVGQASMVLFGKIVNKDEKGGEGTSELVVEKVLKDHEWRKGRTRISLPRYIPDTANYKFLVFCDVFKDKVDPYKGLPVALNSDIAKYLQGALALKDAKPAKRLRFFFDYLDNKDPEISNDAFKEFANADYRDYSPMAKDLPPDRIAKWLKDKTTPSFRFGLYGSLLGHCGKKEHAGLLRKLLDDPDHRLSSGVDGVLAGYVMLEPKEGWKYLKDILADGRKDFLLRYASLRTMRFLWTYRTDLVSKKELAGGAALLLKQSDIADLAIEDLRKWACWDMADRVLGLENSKAYEVKIIRRAILRYALSCKGSVAATAYVAKERKKNAEEVQEAEELLKLDDMPVTPPPVAAKEKVAK